MKAQVNFDSLGGASDLETEYTLINGTGDSAITIPTTKKARAFFGAYTYGSSGYSLCCVDGQNSNAILRDNTDISFSATFSDNSIVTNRGLGAGVTYKLYIVY